MKAIRLREFQISVYTMQRERGGPYKRINKEIQNGRFPTTPEARLINEAFICFCGNTYWGRFCYLDCSECRKISSTVWRGMNSITDEQFAAFQKDMKFVWPSYVSCSSERDQAKKFCRTDPEDETSPIDPNSVLFEIH